MWPLCLHCFCQTVAQLVVVILKPTGMCISIYFFIVFLDIKYLSFVLLEFLFDMNTFLGNCFLYSERHFIHT